MKPVQIFGTAVAALAAITCGCASFGNVMTHPEADVQSLKIMETTSEDIRLMAVLLFHNPNPLTLQLSKLEYRLKVDHVTLATGSLSALPLIRNHQDQTVEIPLVLKTATVFAALPPVGKKSDHAYQFTGQALANNTWETSPIRFESEDTLVFPQIPSIHWAGLHASRNGQKPEFGLEITNPNNFPVIIRRLQGQSEFENQPYTWEFRPANLSVAPQQTRRIFVPCLAAGHPDAHLAVEKITSGGALAYWLQGELECNSPQGVIMVVIHEKGTAGKQNP